MTDLRTAIRWLIEHDLAESAEVWTMAPGPLMEPVVVIEPVAPHFWLGTANVWTEPTPEPFRWSTFYDKLMECYSGGGTFKWAQQPGLTFRGSYVVNPQSAVFLLFLPPEVELVASHSERMDERRQQAKQLTKDIETAWDS